MVVLNSAVGREKIELDNEFDMVDQFAEIMNGIFGECADETGA